MTKPNDTSPPRQADAGQARKPLTAAAQRALAEAEARRAAADSVSRPAEIDGPKGPEPTRYGDWEKGGITSDF